MKCASRSVPRRKRARLYSGKQRSERRERKRDETRRSDCCARYATCDGVVPRVSSVYYSYLISHIILYYYFIYYSIILYRFETSVRRSRRRSTVFRSCLTDFSDRSIFNRIRRSLRMSISHVAIMRSGRQTEIMQSFRLSMFLSSRTARLSFLI